MKFKEFIKQKLGIGMVKESPEHWYRAEPDRHDDEDDEPKKKLEPEPVAEPVVPIVAPFKEGDTVILVDNKKSSKIPDDAWDFLTVYKEFKVRKVSETGKIDLGCHISKNTPEGGVEKIYLFSPKRFALKNASDSPTAQAQSTKSPVQETDSIDDLPEDYNVSRPF